MFDAHFIRPLWLLAVVPFVVLMWGVFRQSPSFTAWSQVCDKHLLPYLIEKKGPRQQKASWLLLASGVLMIISLAGPTWSRFPVPTYQHIEPRVVVLDMSNAMMINDLSPNRLTRAKFKLHDLFGLKDKGQFGLVVYTSEPFVVSPLTDDAQTIDALLSSLTQEVMPVDGYHLPSALKKAEQLLIDAGFHQGQLLVLTGETPSAEAIKTASRLAANGVQTSIMPVMGVNTPKSLEFKTFASAGHGELLSFSDTSSDIDQWLAASYKNKQYTENIQNDMPEWLDEGRWFLIPALLLLLPVFRRGGLA